MKINITEYRIRRGAIRWQISTSVKVIRHTFALSLTVSDILTLNIFTAKTQPKIVTRLHGDLTQALHDRFHDIFSSLGIQRPADLSKLDAARRLSFNDDLFFWPRR